MTVTVEERAFHEPLGVAELLKAPRFEDSRPAFAHTGHATQIHKRHARQHRPLAIHGQMKDPHAGPRLEDHRTRTRLGSERRESLQNESRSTTRQEIPFGHAARDERSTDDRETHVRAFGRGH